MKAKFKKNDIVKLSDKCAKYVKKLLGGKVFTISKVSSIDRNIGFGQFDKRSFYILKEDKNKFHFYSFELERIKK